MKYIDIWARLLSTPTGAGGAQVPVPAGQGWTFAPIQQVRLLINGQVYYDAQQSNNILWSMCDRKTPAQVSTTVLSSAQGNGNAVLSPAVASWVPISFAQLSEPSAYDNDITLGYPIANSVINLQMQFPTDGVYEVTASYHYASALMFSKGTAEYVF